MSLASGKAIRLDLARVYGSWAEMLEREPALAVDERIEAVSIVTPNHAHAATSIAALEAGFDVINAKQLAHSIEGAQAIANAATRTG
jgi:predicted dehydrogenase